MIRENKTDLIWSHDALGPLYRLIIWLTANVVVHKSSVGFIILRCLLFEHNATVISCLFFTSTLLVCSHYRSYDRIVSELSWWRNLIADHGATKHRNAYIEVWHSGERETWLSLFPDGVTWYKFQLWSILLFQRPRLPLRLSVQTCHQS